MLQLELFEAGEQHPKSMQISTAQTSNIEFPIANTTRDTCVSSASPKLVLKGPFCARASLTEASLSKQSHKPANENPKESPAEPQDHDYLPTPRKRMRANNKAVTDTEELYKETVYILKSIETKVEHGLANINKTLDVHLSNICAAILKDK